MELDKSVVYAMQTNSGLNIFEDILLKKKVLIFSREKGAVVQ